MHPYHAEAVIDQEGKIVLSLPFPVGKKVEVVVLPADDLLADPDWSEASMVNALRGFEDDPVTYSKADLRQNGI